MFPGPEKDGPTQGPFPVHEAFPRTTRVHPAMKGFYGSMHVKCIVLFYQEYCRVVIPTANLVGYDWNQMDNVRHPLSCPRPCPHHSPIALVRHGYFEPYSNVYSLYGT